MSQYLYKISNYAQLRRIPLNARLGGPFVFPLVFGLYPVYEGCA
jgi:hypothetical protein